MAFKGIILVVLFVIAAINAQSVDIASTTEEILVGKWSRYYTVTANNVEQANFTLTLQSLEGANIEFQPNALTFSPTTRALSFRVMSNTVNDSAVARVDTTYDGDDRGAFPRNIGFAFKNRTLTVPSFGVAKVNTPSVPLQLVVDVAPENDLSFTPVTENSAFTFTPSTVTIKAGFLSAEFTWKSNVYNTSFGSAVPTRIYWNAAGPQAGWYAPTVADGSLTRFNVELNEWESNVLASNSILVGSSARNPNSFYVYATQNVTQAITIIPQAEDLTFEAVGSNQISPNGNKSVVFNIKAVNPNTAVNKTINIFTSGGNFMEFDYTIQLPALTTSVHIPMRSISVTKYSDAVTINNITYISIAIPAPVNSNLQVLMSAAKFAFNTSSGWAPLNTVTFSGQVTSIVVAVWAQDMNAEANPDFDSISFEVAGGDALLYNRPGAVALAIKKAHFTAPVSYVSDSLAGQDFWVGVKSAPIPIRAAVSPLNAVSVRLVAPNLLIEPDLLHFRNGSEQQYFQVTPLYTNAAVNSQYSTNIEYLIDGPNYAHFEAIERTQITVQQREFQTAWSAHLNTDNNADTAVLRLHKTYMVWASVNYIAKGEEVSFTPVSSYFSFSPKVLNFNGATNRILLEATVIGVPDNGRATIDYIIGGKDGGLYTPAEPNTVTVDLRSLDIVAAQVTTDERVPEKKAILLVDRRWIDENGDRREYEFNPSVLAQYHVHSFLVRTFALPNKDLTITPHSPHVKFSPSKITLKSGNAVKRMDYTAWDGNGNRITVRDTDNNDVTYTFNATGVYAEANFSVEAYAAGTHRVSFELSGADKDFYKRIPVTPMTFNLVMRPDSEPFKAVLSSSSSLLPSFVVAAVVAVFALVL